MKLRPITPLETLRTHGWLDAIARAIVAREEEGIFLEYHVRFVSASKSGDREGYTFDLLYSGSVYEIAREPRVLHAGREVNGQFSFSMDRCVAMSEAINRDGDVAIIIEGLCREIYKPLWVTSTKV